MITISEIKRRLLMMAIRETDLAEGCKSYSEAKHHSDKSEYYSSVIDLIDKIEETL